MSFKVKTWKGKTVSYNIEGIESGSRNTPVEKRQLLMEIITQNLDIKHTHLIQVTQEISNIPKKTIESELNRLQKDQVLFSKKVGKKPNSPRLWRITPPGETRDFIREGLTEEINDALDKVDIVEKAFPKLNNLLRAQSLSFLMYDWMMLQASMEMMIDEFDLHQHIVEVDKVFERIYNLKKKCDPEVAMHLGILAGISLRYNKEIFKNFIKSNIEFN